MIKHTKIANYLLIALLFIFIPYLWQAKNSPIMESVLNYCLQKNHKSLDIKKFTPLEWDAIYVVYGPMVSEQIYRDYNIKGPTNNTQDNNVSYYFIKNNKVVLIENDTSFERKRRNGDALIFHSSPQPREITYHGTSVSTIIPFSHSILEVRKRENENNYLFNICHLYPAEDPRQ